MGQTVLAVQTALAALEAQGVLTAQQPVETILLVAQLRRAAPHQSAAQLRPAGPTPAVAQLRRAASHQPVAQLRPAGSILMVAQLRRVQPTPLAEQLRWVEPTLA